MSGINMYSCSPLGNCQCGVNFHLHEERISIFILSVNPPPVLFCISDTGIPTPHYNASVLSDMFYEQHLHYLYNCLVDFPGMKDAVALLKVWLHQREFDQVCFIKVHT